MGARIKPNDVVARSQSTEDVESRVRRLMVSSFENGKSNDSLVRIGVEVEFFIERLDCKQVELEDAYHFMIAVSQLPGWVRYPVDHASSEISRVSYEVSGVGYHSLKFEHPPHMLEVALAPYSNLCDLNEALTSIFQNFESAALFSGLRILWQSSIKPPQMNWDEINSLNPRYRALAATREKMVADSFKNEKWVHFTTYTAATQFHIGGVPWWKHSNHFVEQLYLVELFASRNAYEITNSGKDIDARFKERWAGYFKVFNGLKLLGFPDLERWTMEQWVRAFCQSSLVLVPEDPFFGKNLKEISEVLSDGELLRAMNAVRDLQIIKPKFFGTLEFRADPAFPDVDTILKQAAFRFGLYLYAASGGEFHSSESFRRLRERWNSGVDISGLETSFEEYRKLVREVLKNRGFGEERFL